MQHECADKVMKVALYHKNYKSCEIESISSDMKIISVEVLLGGRVLYMAKCATHVVHVWCFRCIAYVSYV